MLQSYGEIFRDPEICSNQEGYKSGPYFMCCQQGQVSWSKQIPENLQQKIGEENDRKMS